MLTFLAFCLTLFFSAVLGFPLAERDVVSPHITNPHQGTVWVVGSTQQVTWETDNLPPDSQITNPIGRVILGFQENDSLNLQLDHPLAQNFKLRAGTVTITVPNVPPRDDYIIVLMGDSGNASPAFAITSIKGGDSTTASGIFTASGSSLSTPTSSDNSPPITGNTITGGASTPASGGTSSASANASSASASASATPESTPTASVSLGSSSSAPQLPSTVSTTSSHSATVAGSAAAAQSSTSAAWSVHSYQLWSVIAVPLALSVLI